MSVDGTRLFDLALPEALAAAARRVTGLAGQEIDTPTVKTKDGVNLVGYFTDNGVPTIECASGYKPSLEEVALEVLRLELRGGQTEQYMPYSEMRHEMNRRLCTSLFRTVEQEVLLALSQSHGVASRGALQKRLLADFLEPLQAGKYRSGDLEPARTRLGSLDGLELLISYADNIESMNLLQQIAACDPAMASQLAVMYRVVQNNRPFDDSRRIRDAYYLSVPFLFDTRKPATPKVVVAKKKPKKAAKKAARKKKA